MLLQMRATLLALFLLWSCYKHLQLYDSIISSIVLLLMLKWAYSSDVIASCGCCSRRMKMNSRNGNWWSWRCSTELIAVSIATATTFWQLQLDSTTTASLPPTTTITTITTTLDCWWWRLDRRSVSRWHFLRIKYLPTYKSQLVLLRLYFRGQFIENKCNSLTVFRNELSHADGVWLF